MRKLALGSVLVALVGAALAVPGPAASADFAEPTYVEGVTLGEPVRMQYTDPAQVGGPGEPSIKVDDAGTIYVAGVCCVGRAAPAWYSQDDGETFANLPSPGGARELTLGAEGDFIVDDADGVYFVDTWVPSLMFTRWSGHGDTWEYTEDTTIGVLPGVDDRPWLAYSNGAVYLYVNHVTHVSVYRSTDGGHTWDTAFDTIGRGQLYWPGHVAADRRSGDVYLFGEGCGQGSGMCAAVSRDGGDTWTEHPAGTLPRGGFAPFMVAADVDAAGNVYGVYADTNDSGCDVYLSVSTDRGETWTQYRVNPDDGCATFPWVAAGDDGRVSVVWYQNAAPKSQNQVPGAAEWRLRAAVITEATSQSPTITHGTMDQVVHRGPLGRDLWDFQQIDVGPDGRFHIAAVEDVTPACSGPMLAGYQNKCTIYVPQTGGPRALTHAVDATSVDGLEAAATGAGLDVSGSVTFGRAAPEGIVDSDQQTEFPPPVDIIDGTIVRTSATSEDLVLTLNIEDVPEVVGGAGNAFTWSLKAADGTESTVTAAPRPRTFEVCSGGSCATIPGDADAGGDRIVARVPLSLIGASPGEALEVEAADSRLQGSPPMDVAMSPGPYTIPDAQVEVVVTDAGGMEVAGGPASLSEDLGGFTASLTDLPPGTYTVRVEACFGGNCASEMRPVIVG